MACKGFTLGADSSDRKRRAKRKKADRVSAYNPESFVVHVGSKTSLLVYSSPFCGPVVVARAPACLGLASWMDFLKAGLVELRTMRKPEVPSDAIPQYVASIDGLLDQYPLLAEYMAATAYDGLAPGSRVPCSLLIFGQDNAWKSRLQDKNVGKCLWSAAESLLDIFHVTEQHLAKPFPDWRLDRHAGHQQAKREEKKKGS